MRHTITIPIFLKAKMRKLARKKKPLAGTLLIIEIWQIGEDILD
jgi:hypothetical protein